jgi:hypothetical protein
MFGPVGIYPMDTALLAECVDFSDVGYKHRPHRV